MSFVELRFPDDISSGSFGGPEFSTDIVMSSGGREYRNINWRSARSRYNVAYGVKNKMQMSALVEFFYARRGRAIGFRFKDWGDYKAENQSLGVGDGLQNKFQLIKQYGSNANAYIRKIDKPVQNTVHISSNGVVMSSSKYRIDYSTGVVSFNSPIPKGHEVTADFEFDVPVRFDVDKISTSIDTNNFRSCKDIALVELIL